MPRPVNSNSQNPTALITGASSGIGQALAQRYALAGHDVILVARSVDKLQDLRHTLQTDHGVRAHVLPSDLSMPDAAAQLQAAVARKRLSVDVLVNCAGVLMQGPFSGMTGSTHQQMIDLNISGLTAMLSAFLPGMAERAAQGHRVRVLNVASIAAFQPLPMLATYAATKAYVLSLGESLAEELKGTGITVTTLCPGITATPMVSGAANANSKINQIPGFMIGSVDHVVAQAFDACQRGDAICVPGIVNQAFTLGSRSSPKWLVRKIGGLLGRNALS
jgi:uncharacterized protein